MKPIPENKQLPKQAGVFVNVTQDHTLSYKPSHGEFKSAGVGKKTMNIETVENIIKKFIKPFESVTFFWRGEDPLSPGIGFYQRVIDLEKKYSVRSETEVKNKLKSKAALIDDKIITFLSKEEFNIIINIDSLVKVNENVKRVWYTKGATCKIEPSFKKIQNYQNPEVLFVVNRRNSDDAENIYPALKEKGVEKVKFQPYQGADPDLMLDNKRFYEFHRQIYDLWVNDPEPLENVLPLNNIVRGFLSRGERLFTSNCFQRNLSIDATGNIYPCAIFGDEEFKLGNINTSSLEEVFYSEKKASLLERDEERKNKCKDDCGYFLVCQGGCIKENFLCQKELFSRNYFCSGNKKLYSYIAKDLEQRIKCHKNPSQVFHPTF